MSDQTSPPSKRKLGILTLWHALPLYSRIMGALALGVIAGLWLHERAESFRMMSDLILRLLRALVTPLIFVAVVHSLLQAQAGGKMARKMAFLLATNTLVAIAIGLIVANVIQPGHWAKLAQPKTAATMPTIDPNRNFDAAVEQSLKRLEEKNKDKPLDPLSELVSKIPDSIVGSFTAGKDVISVIIIAVAFGISLRIVRTRHVAAGRTGYLTVENVIETVFECLMVALHWIIDLVPFAVFAVVARVIGTQGFSPFISLGAFVVSVLVALILQVGFYLTRVSLSSWIRPGRFLKGGADALMTAFATASSTATMPITYTCLREKVGLREEPASMGALVGSNFNNDGTALYEAMAPLFIAQAIGIPIALPRQIVVAFMAVVASVGAPGIPEAGLVTMLLVFTTVGLPVEYVPLLLTVDWFLDRCRTAVNVMGDMTVACCLEGKSQTEEDAPLPEPVP